METEACPNYYLYLCVVPQTSKKAKNFREKILTTHSPDLVLIRLVALGAAVRALKGASGAGRSAVGG